MRVSEKRRINADRATVWAWICDPARYPEFMDGVSRWDIVGDKNTGCGARWDVRLKVGSAPVGGLVEVVEYAEPGDIAWNSITGVTMRGRWRLRERGSGVTEVDLRLAYQAPGGLMGLLADRVAGPLVSRSLKRSLRNLQMLVESRPAPSRVEAARQAAESASSDPKARESANRRARHGASEQVSSSTTATKPAKAAKKAQKATKAAGTKSATRSAGTAAKSTTKAQKATKAQKRQPSANAN